MTIGPLLLDVARPLLPGVPRLEPEARAQVERELEDFLSAEVEAMPSYLGLLFSAALTGFEWLPVLRYGRRYSALSPERQYRVVRAWSRSPVGPVRDFVKLVRSCALYFYLDHPLVMARLELESEERAGLSETSRAH